MSMPQMLQNAFPDKQTLRPGLCPICEAEFTPRRRWQRFCSSACRRAHHKAAGGGDMHKRMADLEQRVRELEAQAWPLGK